jgi:signal peptidase I
MKTKISRGGIANVILEFIQSIVLALSVFVLLYLFVAQPNQIDGRSMDSNFADKEYVVTDKLTYKFKEPQRGDVVVFKAPPTEPCAENDCEYIKRIVAVGGDRVKVENGDIYLNGEVLDQSFLDEGIKSDPGQFLQEGVEKTIEDGYFLCLGDNRPYSRDSREFGPIKRESIVGRAVFKYWPLSSVGGVPKVRF